MRKLLWGLMLSLCLPFPAASKTLYVVVSGGSDATSYAANGPGAPWSTICRALRGTTSCTTSSSGEAAQPGDTVLVGPGTYAQVGLNTKYPVLNAVNSGTSGSPIQIRTNGGHVVLTFSSNSGGMLGCNAVNYVQWIGTPITAEWQIDESTAPSRSDTGPLVMWDTTGCLIEGTRVDGNGWPVDHSHTLATITSSNASTDEFTTSGAHGLSGGEGVLIAGHSGTISPVDGRGYYVVGSTPTSTTFTVVNRFSQIAVDITAGGTGGTASRRRNDNHGCLYTASAVNSTYRRNYCTDITGYGMNSGCVVTYFSSGLTLEYNQCSNSGSGFFLKGNASPAGGFTVRYNVISDVEESCVTYHRTTLSSPNYADIYQNICYDSGTNTTTYPNESVAGSGIRIYPFDTGANEPVRIRVVNNTIARTDICLFASGAFVANSGHVLRNNICADMASSVLGAYHTLGRDATSVSTLSQFDSDYNLFKAPLLLGTGSEGGETDYTTLTSWRAATNQDQNSSVGDPLFVNAAGNDYRLSVGSPALSGGFDLLDLDCDGSTGDTIARGAYVRGVETFGPTGSAECVVSTPTPRRFRFKTIGE